jgi:hypothetical protein
MIAVGLERGRVYVGVKNSSGQASVGKAIILLDIRVQVRRRSSSPQFGGGFVSLLSSPARRSKKWGRPFPGSLVCLHVSGSVRAF